MYRAIKCIRKVNKLNGSETQQSKQTETTRLAKADGGSTGHIPREGNMIGESRTRGTTKHNMIGVRTCSCICGNIRGYERIDDTISIVCF